MPDWDCVNGMDSECGNDYNSHFSASEKLGGSTEDFHPAKPINLNLLRSIEGSWRTFDDWKSLGYVVKSGQKASAITKLGTPLFSYAQVVVI